MRFRRRQFAPLFERAEVSQYAVGGIDELARFLLLLAPQRVAQAQYVDDAVEHDAADQEDDDHPDAMANAQLVQEGKHCPVLAAGHATVFSARGR